MLKQAFISLATRRHRKRKKTSIVSGYHNASAIGIIVNAKESFPRGIDDFSSQFRSEGKSVNLIFVGDKTTHLGSDCHVIRDHDFSILGDPKTDDIKAFTKKKYDYIILIDHSGDPLVELLASMCDSPCLVGYHDYPATGLLTLRIKPEKERDLEDISRYLKMIDNE